MWCLTLTSGQRSFHPTEQAAHNAAGSAEHVVWFDSFDYELHNPGESAARYAQRVEHERSLGRAYVGVLLDGLCRRFGLDPATWRNPKGA